MCAHHVFGPEDLDHELVTEALAQLDEAHVLTQLLAEDLDEDPAA